MADNDASIMSQPSGSSKGGRKPFEWSSALTSFVGGVAALLLAALIFWFLGLQPHLAHIDSEVSGIPTFETATTKHLNKLDLKVSTLKDAVTDLGNHSAERDTVNSILKDISAIEGRQDDLQVQVENQTALIKLENPSRILAIIRSDVETAIAAASQVAEPRLAEYRSAIQAVPPSTLGYWQTVAAVVNYQSRLNQMSGEAPDPSQISQPCAGLTQGSGGYNYFGGTVVVSGCIVDLDSTHNIFHNVIFKNSVIRYHGGAIPPSKMIFINCAFFIEVSSSSPPLHPAFLIALLKSAKQKVVKVAPQS